MASNKVICGVVFLLFISSNADAQQTAVTAEQVILQLEHVNGITPGARRNHIQGICASGNFVGSNEATSYSSSPLFSGEPIPVIARFSMAGGSLKAPDSAKSPRGMALEFDLPKGNKQHFTMLNVPIFSAATPESFYDAVVAGEPDPNTGKSDPEKIRVYRELHPDAMPLIEFMGKNNPPVSYANSSYYSIHTFKFVNDGISTLVRWRFEPEDGVKRLTNEEMNNGSVRFLEQALLERVKRSPIRWNMILTIGHPDDEQRNPTVYWPKDRTEIKAGVLTLTQATHQEGAPCEKINFDPLVMSDGIEPTDDPILRFRSLAYAASFTRRLTGQ